VLPKPHHQLSDSTANKLESYRLTEVFIADGDAATDFAEEPGVFDKVLILFWITNLEAEVVQITKVLVVSAVRHIYISHKMRLLNKKVVQLLFIRLTPMHYSKHQHNKKNN